MTGSLVVVVLLSSLLTIGCVSGATFSYQDCVRVEANITLSITYQDKNNKTVTSDPVPITDDSETLDGQCYHPKRKDPYPHVGFPTGYPDDSVIRGIWFDFHNSADVVSMSISVEYDLSRLHGFSGDQTTVNVQSEWIKVSHINSSYLCTTPISMSMGDRVVASVNTIQAQAYNMKSGMFSNSTEGCNAFPTTTPTKPSTTKATTTKLTPTTPTTTKSTPTTNTTQLFSYKECVRVEVDIKLEIKYQGLENKTQTSGPIDITDNTVAAVGQCATVKDPYPYVGKPTGYPDDSVIRGIWFYFNNSADIVSMRIEVEYDPSLLPNSEEKEPMMMAHSEWMAVSHIDNSYLCPTLMSWFMGDKVVASVNMIHAQAYHMKSGMFSNSTDACNAFPTTTPTKPSTTKATTTKLTPTTPTTTKSTPTTPTTTKPTPTTNTTKLFSYKECVRVEADIKLEIKYQGLKNKTQTSGPIDITDNTVAAVGLCASSATVNDPYPYVGKPTGYPDDSVIRGIWFYFKSSADIVSMRIEVEYDPSLLPNSEEKETMMMAHSEWMAVSHIDNSYLCTTLMSWFMGDKVVASVNMIHAQAYHMKFGMFSNSTDGCNAFPTTTPTKPSTTKATTTKLTPTTPTTTKSTPTTPTTTKPTPTTNTTNLFSWEECVRVEADIKLEIKYQDLKNKTQTSGPIDITDNTVAAVGQCASAATVKDPYPYVGKPTGYPDDSVIRGIWFYFNNSADVVSMRIEVEYDPSLLPKSGEKEPMMMAHSEWMAVSHIDNSYLCPTLMSWFMGDKVVASVNTIHAQAYHMKSGMFSNSTDGCNAFPTTTPTKPSTTKATTTKLTPTTPTTTKSTPTTPTTTKSTSTSPTTPTTTTPTTTKPTPTIPTSPTTTKTTPKTNITTSTTSRTTTSTAMSTTSHIVDKQYSVRGDSKTVCLVLEAAITFNLHHNQSMMMFPINSNDAVSTSGSCSDTKDILSLRWTDKHVEINLTMEFTEDGKNYSMSAVNITWSETGTGNRSTTYKSKMKQFDTSIGDHYDCKNETTIKLEDGNSISIKDLKIQAFRTGNNTDMYGTQNDCYYHAPKPATSSIVPIAVGVALGVMVVIVLVGYCIGRRRARTSGYETVP